MSQHVAFLLPNFGAGGAERLTLDLMRGFAARGAQVDLVLQSATGEFLELLPPEVRVVNLNAARLRGAVAPLRRYYRAARPDAVVAAMWPLTTVALLARLGLRRRPRVVVAEHCSLVEQYAPAPTRLAAIRASLRAGYRFADAIVAVSQGLADEVAGLSGLSASRVKTIHNPIPVPLCSAAGADWGGLPGKRVLAVGKLKPQKNFVLLVEAFARLARDRAAVLAIVGDGPQRGAIEARARELGVADRLLLPGFTATPGDWYAGADLFALSSDYEGFGNVLVEAMHAGLPVVATACRHGPAEVLGDGHWGLLVPPGDASALATAMGTALDQPADPDRQRARAAEFSVERAVDAYWQAAFLR